MFQWLVNKISRSTTSGQFIPEIDGLRFIAILSVIFYHLSLYLTVKTGRTTENDPLVALFLHGGIGVTLFFVISGFVIALPFARGHFGSGDLPKLRQFYFRRLTRLEPPYIINLLISFFLTILFTNKLAGNLFPHLLASIGYVHNIIYREFSLVNGVAWSLEIELQFYLLSPFIASIFKIRSKVYRRGLLIAIIATFSIMSYVINNSPLYELSILNAAQFFLTGFILVDVFLIEYKQQYKKNYLWDVISVISWFCICTLLFQGKIGMLLMAAPIFLAYLAAFKGKLSNRFFCIPLIYLIGGMCYTIYLYHYLIISGFGRIFITIGCFSYIPLWFGIIIISMILLPIIMLCCTFLFIIIEKPCMKKDWHLKLGDRLMIWRNQLKNMFNIK
jgi:peptidoglycan/LPS O-acetylase OafA/YrhL